MDVLIDCSRHLLISVRSIAEIAVLSFPQLESRELVDVGAPENIIGWDSGDPMQSMSPLDKQVRRAFNYCLQ